jgi:hypothetical protein
MVLSSSVTDQVSIVPFALTTLSAFVTRSETVAAGLEGYPFHRNHRCPGSVVLTDRILHNAHRLRKEEATTK